MAFTKQLSLELGIETALAKQDIAKLFLQLEELHDEAIRKALEPEEPVLVMSPDEQHAALSHLAAVLVLVQAALAVAVHEDAGPDGRRRRR